MTPVELLKQQQQQKQKRKSARSAGLTATRTELAATRSKRQKRSRQQRLTDAAAQVRPSPYRQGLDWANVLWIAMLHVGALSALFFFTWKGVLLMLVLGWFSGAVGITMGYHRLLTHGSFSTQPWVRRALAFIGGLAGEGPAIQWVAVHRKHHEFSDHEGDPHSPREGFWWAHMMWLAPRHTPSYKQELHERYAPDLVKDPFMRFLDKTFILWHWVLGMALFAVGYYVWDAYTAWSFVAYGMFLRLVYVLHITWLVNSATHKWGYRNYETTDDSRNLWWVGLLAYGEGWHNNHHAYQRMARHGHRWWEVDMTYWMICGLEKLGLAWNVVRDLPHRRHSHSATP